MSTRVNIIDQQIVSPRERTAFEIAKSAAHAIELVEVDAGYGIEITYHLHLGTGRLHHVRLLADEAYDPLRHVARKRQHRTARRPNQDIRAGAPRMSGDIPKHALAHAHQREDHGDLNPNGDGTEQSSHRPVLEIF